MMPSLATNLDFRKSKSLTWRTWRLGGKSLFKLALLLSSSPLTAFTVRDSSTVVKVTALPSYDPTSRGHDFYVAFRIEIEPKWHINGANGLPQGFIPLSIRDSKGSPLPAARAPQGVPKTLAGSQEPFPVYEGAVTVFLPVRLESPAGRAVTLQYGVEIQACDDATCLPPATIPVKVPVRVASVGNEKPANLAWFEGLGRASTPAEENLIAKLIRQKGWWLTFLLILLGGLALNLTPCVYPMIPLTVAYFGTRKDDGPYRMLARASAYVLGISVTYTALGVTAALSGRLFGSALQSPYVLTGISLVLVALSLSMFGLYEIQAPSWLLNRIGGTTTSGVMGAFGMGLVFGVVAAPCVDPFSIGLLTFVAAKADPYLGFALFFTLSLGLGLPYLLLGFFSGEIQKLPKSGVWMVWVKKVFGFVLLGMPLYFLYAYLPESVAHGIVAAYIAVVGVLLGWAFAGKGVHPTFKTVQHLFGAALVLGAVALVLLWPKPIHLPFEPYSPERLAAAQKAGQKVFLDFSADWCIPCREMELKTFPDPRVREALKDWVLLKADLTRFDEGDVKELRTKWNISGVPTILLIGPDGRVLKDGRLVGYISADELAGHIAKP